MWIKSILLNNWRAYKEAKFDIPRAEGGANVVVVGAKNGIGKTSLLEAITICLYGAKGIFNLGRANSSALGNLQSERLAYQRFMDGVFYRGGDQSRKASVEIVFDMGDDNEVSIKRIWRFDANNRFRSSEEELFVSENGRPFDIPALDEMVGDDARMTALEKHIEDQFLPSSLSPFFLFDGSQVQKMARRNKKDQIKDGIERILGIHIFQSLIKNLDEYADIRSRGDTARRASSAKLDELKRKIAAIQARIDELDDEMNNLTEEIKKAQDELDILQKKLEECGVNNTVEAVGELYEERARIKGEQDELVDELTKILISDFALLLAGNKLISGTASRLQKETNRRRWEQQRDDGEGKYKEFLENLRREKVLDSLSLPKEDVARLLEKIKVAWDRLWYPMSASDDCADVILNPGFFYENFKSATERLGEISSSYTCKRITEIRVSISRLGVKLQEIKERIAKIQRGDAEESKRLLDELMAKQDSISTLEERKRTCQREKEAKEHELAGLRQERSRQIAREQQTEPSLRLSERAGQAVEMLKEIIALSLPKHISDIAATMTAAYVWMSNNELVSEVRIADDCEINLISGGGSDVRDMELSHGEKQIFSLALIAAIAKVSGKKFPFIIDTPLANLDKTHRREFLRYFSSKMDNQVFFLSTDEEIRSRQKMLLKDSLAATFLVEQELHEDIGVNFVRPNRYFEEVDHE